MRVYGIQTHPHELFNVGPSTLDPIEITTSGCYLVRRCGVSMTGLTYVQRRALVAATSSSYSTQYKHHLELAIWQSGK